jgi:hypothetical protein
VQSRPCDSFAVLLKPTKTKYSSSSELITHALSSSLRHQSLLVTGKDYLNLKQFHVGVEQRKIFHQHQRVSVLQQPSDQRMTCLVICNNFLLLMSQHSTLLRNTCPNEHQLRSINRHVSKNMEGLSDGISSTTNRCLIRMRCKRKRNLLIINYFREHQIIYHCLKT